jgi:hypothetical protein
MLKALPQMKKLTSFDLDLGNFPFQEAVPYIVKGITATLALEFLSLASNTDASCVLDIVDAWQNVPSLSSFKYSNTATWDEKLMPTLEKKLLVLLETHTALMEITFSMVLEIERILATDESGIT